MIRPRVRVEPVGRVLHVGLARPEKRNAFDSRMLAELAAAYGRLADDDDLRAGMLYAHGEHFSAGLDLSEVAPLVAERGPEVLAGGGRFDPFATWADPVPKPVVVAVQGIAYTAAIELVLAADVAVCSDDARFRQLEVGRGLLPYGGATFRATSRLGWGNAMRLLLTAEELGAEEALRIGLVQEVVLAGKQVERAAEIAALIAEQAPLGVQGALANARVARAQAESAARDHLRELLPSVLASEDAAEGLTSFAERRPGAFRGR